ncbi:peptidase M41 family protein [Mycobacterium xenopi 3993]|nr:peptidase M41 family protein [Mycobacterium xenopi 3993]
MRTRSEMISQLVFAMGGRAAEELVFREPTTGAVSDIEQATKIARAMVTEFGMSSKLGAVKYGTEHGDPFLGRTIGTQPDYSHEVARDIDEEIRKLIEAAHTEAWEILTEYRDVLDTLAGELLEKETCTAPSWKRYLPTSKSGPAHHVRRLRGRIPSDKPPIKTPASWPKSAVSRGRRRARTRVQSGDRTSQRRGGGGRARAKHQRRQRCTGSPGAGDGRVLHRGAPLSPTTAPGGWRGPGWPPQQPNYWYPPPSSPPQSSYRHHHRRTIRVSPTRRVRRR